MLIKDLVLVPGEDLYNVPLFTDSNFTVDSSVLGNNFTITVRTYIDYFSYFTIKANNEYLCLNNLAKLGVNFCYTPATTIDGNRHVFFLLSNDSSITTVHHSYFEKSIFLYYFQTKYHNILTQI